MCRSSDPAIQRILRTFFEIQPSFHVTPGRGLDRRFAKQVPSIRIVVYCTVRVRIVTTMLYEWRAGERGRSSAGIKRGARERWCRAVRRRKSKRWCSAVQSRGDGGGPAGVVRRGWSDGGGPAGAVQRGRSSGAVQRGAGVSGPAAGRDVKTHVRDQALQVARMCKREGGRVQGYDAHSLLHVWHVSAFCKSGVTLLKTTHSF